MNNASDGAGITEAIQEPAKSGYIPHVKLAMLIVGGIIILALISRQCRSPSTDKKSHTEVLLKLENDCASLVKNATNDSLDKTVKWRYIERSIGSLSMLQKVYNSNILTITQKHKDGVNKMMSKCIVARRQLDEPKHTRTRKKS